MIEAVSRLKDEAQTLLTGYVAMVPAIAAEHRAIRSGQFVLIEASRHEKELVGEKIEIAYGNLTQASERLSRAAREFLARDIKRPQNLSECNTLVDEILETLVQGNHEGLGPQVLRHVASGLKKVTEEFFTKYKEIKPLIEANRMLVQTVLRNVQESYRFWTEVSEKIAVSYNKDGVQKAQGRNSGFKATA